MANPILEALKQTRRPFTDIGPLEEETEPGLWSSIGSSTLGGVSMAANILDLPGSMVRDALGGENPFDQLWPSNWGSAENRLSGRDLARRYGLVGSQDTWGNFFGGLGAEILLDPTTYLGPGALLKGAAAGLRGASTVGKAARAGGGLLEAGIPFLTKTAQLMTGPKAVTAAELVGRGTEAVGQTAPMLAANRLFDASVQGMKTVLTQAMGRSYTKAYADEVAEIHGEVNELARKLETEGLETVKWRTVKPNETIPPGTRTRLNPSNSSTEIIDSVTKLTGADALTPEAGSVLRQQVEVPNYGTSNIAATMKRGMQKSLSQQEFWGVTPDTELMDQLPDGVLGFLPRRIKESIYKNNWLGSLKGKRKMSQTTAADVERNPALKGFKHGTEGVDRLFGSDDFKEAILKEQQNLDVQYAMNAPKPDMDAEAAAADGRIADWIAVHFGGEIERHYQPVKGAKKLYQVGNAQQYLSAKHAAAINATPVMNDRYLELAKLARKHSEMLEKQLFGHMHPAVAYEHYRLNSAAKVQRAKHVFTFMADNSSEPFMALKPGDDSVELKEVLRKLGFRSRTAAKRIAEMKGMPTDKDTLRAVLRRRIAKKEAESLLVFEPNYQAPQELGGALNAFDSYNALFKAAVLTMPARFVRDAVSGQVQNVLNGWFTLHDAGNAALLLRGGVAKGYTSSQPVIDWLNKRQLPINDENATEALRQMYAQYRGGLSHPEMDLLDQSRGVDSGLESILERVPGRHSKTIFQSAKDVASAAVGKAPGTDWNPIHVRGFDGQVRSRFGPFVAGDMVGRFVDDMNRLTPFMYRVGRLGENPAKVMAEIGKAQVEYGSHNFTRFEKTWMKRLFPFYSFMKGMIPYVANELITNPGGRMRQVVRATAALRGDDPTVPSYVGDTAAIPLGTLPDGSQSYMTGFGFMHENPLSMLGSPAAMGRDLLSNMTPLIKGPLEYATGQSFFQSGPEGGRPLRELNPPIGQTLANVANIFRTDQLQDPVRYPFQKEIELAASNSPLSRLITSARTLTDPRKNALSTAANLLTGFRVTDVSVPAQERALEEQASALMRRMGGRTFERPYFLEEDLERMNAPNRALAEKLLDLQQRIVERRAVRKEQKAAQP